MSSVTRNGGRSACTAPALGVLVTDFCFGDLSVAERERVQALLLKAYRWQYIVSGVQQSRFNNVLTSLTTQEQQARIGAALEPIMAAFTAH